MAEKEAVMVLKVDLQCPCCYKKVKKIICKFPQIRNQVYDEKSSTVTISVICCSPEKIRDKLCSKGRKVIKSIEIKEAADSLGSKPEKETEKPKKPKVVEVEQPRQPQRPKVIGIEQPFQPEKPKLVGIEKPKQTEKPKVVVIENPNKLEKPKVDAIKKSKDSEKPKEKSKEAQPSKILEPTPNPLKMIRPVAVDGFPSVYSVQPYYGTYYEGHGGGSFYNGHGVPPPQPCYYGHGNGFHVTEYDNYFSEENPQGCSIM